MNGSASFEIRDTDANGTKELILHDNGGAWLWYCSSFGGPVRGKEVIFRWDGLHFLYSSLELDPPKFRFQAVQDADRYFLLGDYENALRYYRDVIFSEELDWWSKEKLDFICTTAYLPEDQPQPPLPEEDKHERPALEAYARYRLLLYWLAGGWLNDAQIVYDTLIERFPTESPGFPYAEMATLLWDEYQQTGDVSTACVPVVSYVDLRPEVLDPLENSHTSLQNHRYESIDVCPFASPIFAPPLP
jgi:hypothetical protein